ncbi:MAG TPA: hypothetical protein VHP37_22920 [Burkholderiales bacterium]|nr:hypothetical protein [Burkholderiales bacterium]
MKTILSCMFAALSLAPTSLVAQNPRPACVLMAAVDLKPLLGADHEAPAPYGDSACVAKSKTPGRLVLLAVIDKPNAELKKDLAAFKKQMSAPEAAQAMTLAPAPEFGPEAYSTREKGERSAADITALKGNKSVNLTLNWSKGPITDPIFKQLRDLMTSVLARLP